MEHFSWAFVATFAHFFADSQKMQPRYFCESAKKMHKSGHEGHKSPAKSVHVNALINHFDPTWGLDPWFGNPCFVQWM